MSTSDSKEIYEEEIFEHEVMLCPACNNHFARACAFFVEDLYYSSWSHVSIGTRWTNIYECACNATWSVAKEYRTCTHAPHPPRR
jgi:hypothetical protein